MSESVTKVWYNKDTKSSACACTCQSQRVKVFQVAQTHGKRIGVQPRDIEHEVHSDLSPTVVIAEAVPGLLALLSVVGPVLLTSRKLSAKNLEIRGS